MNEIKEVFSIIQKARTTKITVILAFLVPADDTVGDFAPQDIVSERIGAGEPFGKMPKSNASDFGTFKVALSSQASCKYILLHTC